MDRPRDRAPHGDPAVTVIAAMVAGDRVVMGCDTASDNDGTIVYRADGKIAALHAPDGDKILLGAAGNAGILAALRRNLKIDGTPRTRGEGKPRAHGAKVADQWANTIAEGITDILAAVKPPLTQSHSGNADTLDGVLLMAWRQYLWVIHTHAAIRPHSAIAAIRCGKDLALGSLHTVANSVVDPESAMSYAIQLACAYDSGCGVDERGPLIHSTVGQPSANGQVYEDMLNRSHEP